MSAAWVVHVKDNVPHAVYIGRAMPRQGLKASKWANPHKIGGKATHFLQKDPITREGALMGYVQDIMYGDKRHLLADLPELRGKPLACWCRHDGETFGNGTDGSVDNRCHGDLLVHWLETFTDDELREMAVEE